MIECTRTHASKHMHKHTNTNTFTHSHTPKNTLTFTPTPTHTYIALRGCGCGHECEWKGELLTYTYKQIHSLSHSHSSTSYGVATTSRLLNIIGLFCRIWSLLQGFFAQETYHFKESTNRSHPIPCSAPQEFVQQCSAGRISLDLADLVFQLCQLR